MASVGFHGASKAASSQIESGTALFGRYCSSCHGNDLNGGSGPSLVDDIWLHGSDDESIVRSIKAGYPLKNMPAWRDILTDTQVRALLAYIHDRQVAVEPMSTPSDAIVLPSGVLRTELHNFRIEPIVEGLEMPWSFTLLPDGKVLLLSVQRGLEVFDPKRIQLTRINRLSLCASSGGAGFRDVKRHPKYAENGWVYISYDCDGVQKDDGWYGVLSIVRGRLRNGEFVDQQRLWHAAPEFYTQPVMHDGGRMAFDDRGYLYFAVGMYGSISKYEDGLVSQDLHQPLGKIHRLHDDGRVPVDNPFVNVPQASPSIWTLGHRNAQGLTFDPSTGLLWSSEHGPAGGDELNLIEHGRNYGWPKVSWGLTYEGAAAPNGGRAEGIEQPTINWTPSIGVSAITFYEGRTFPEWRGNLFVGSLKQEELLRIVLRENREIVREVILHGLGRVRDVHPGPDGNIYVLLEGHVLGDDRAIARLVRLVSAN